MNDRLVSPKVKQEELALDLSLRPKRLDEYIGQDKVKENLKILIEAAKARNEPVDHILIYGPPGLGKCITADSLILTTQGLVEFRSLVPAHLSAGQYAPCQVNIYGRNGVERASHIYANGRTRTIHLRTRSGFELEGTPNHPVLVATADGPRWKRLSELTNEDYVAIARGTEAWGESQAIDFQPRYLSNDIRRAGADRKAQLVHEALMNQLHRPPTGRELEVAYNGKIRRNAVPYNAARRLGLPLSNGNRIPSQLVELAGFSTKPLGWKAPKRVNGDLAYLMGLLVGDGHFEQGANAPAFIITASEPQIQNEIVRIGCEQFGWRAQVKRYGEKAPRVRFSQNLGHFMIHLGVKPVLAGDKVIPSSVLAGPADVARGFLQGLFDADGHAGPEGYIDWCSKSELLARQVQILLANFGVIGHRSAKRANGETYWQLFIGGRDAALFYQKIGFRLSRKQERAAQLGRFKRGPNRSDRVPCANIALAKLINASRPHSHAMHKRFEHTKNGDRVLSRSEIDELLNLLPQSARNLPPADTLNDLCDSRFYWDKVVSLEPGEAEVFDFCVPGTHSFVANAFFNHNTTLANVAANELGVSIKTTSGPAIERPGDLAAVLTNLRANDILFIDEVHRLARQVEEILYPAMEDGALDIMIGKGPSARSIRLKLPHFTIIGATTRFAMMSAPLRGRFGAIYRLDFYDMPAMETIVDRSARILGVDIDKAGVTEIAKRARGTPRVANRLLKRVRDFAQVRANGAITSDVAHQALSMLEVDQLGLDDVDRKVLQTIIDKFGGGPVGLDTIAASISEESDTIMDVYEPYLLQLGFLDRTPRGRVATRRAYEHLGVNPPERPEQAKLL